MEGIFNIDRSKWHKLSYLGHYDKNATLYENIRTRCIKCEESFIFPAESQKHAFEIEQKYPGWLPRLCPICSKEWSDVQQKIFEYDHAWEANHCELVSDLEFINNWIALLKQALLFRKKHFESRIRMLKKVIDNSNQETPNK